MAFALPRPRTSLRAACIGVALLLGSLQVVGRAYAQVADVSDYLQRMDGNGDGEVSQGEYLQWMLYAFDRMDRDGDGVLVAAELPGGKGRPITRQAHERVLLQRFHAQDANRDGRLDARELAAPPR